VLEDYDIDPYYLLQVAGLIEPGMDKSGVPRAPSIKRKAILQMNVHQARAGWDSATEGSVASSGYSVTTAGSHSGADSLQHDSDSDGGGLGIAAARQRGRRGANRLKLLRWFWCSVFGQRYENAPNSQAEKDFGELNRWMGAEPNLSLSPNSRWTC